MAEPVPAAPESQPANSVPKASERSLLRRLRVPLGIVLLLMLVRMALPYALRPILEDQITEQLVGHIEIGDVEVGLLSGRFGLRNVAIFEERAQAPEPELPAAPMPLIAVGRLAVRIAPLALFDRIVRLSEIEIEQPAIDLARLADGKMNVLRVIPESELEPESEPEKPAEPWIVAIDRVTLVGGKLVFNDLAVSGAEALDLAIDRIAVEGLKIGGEPTPDQPARITLEAHHPDGPLNLDLTVQQLLPTPVLQAHLVLADFPLRRASVYVPGVGWSGLEGSLGLDLSVEFEPGMRSLLTGKVSVDDVVISVPGLDTPALGWKTLGIAIEQLDLVARKARIERVAFAGLAVVVTPGEEPVLPLLRPPSDPAKRAPELSGETAASPSTLASAQTQPLGSAPASAGESAPPTPGGESPAPAKIEPEAPPPTEQPFEWVVREVQLDEARVLLRGAHVQPLDLALKAHARKISGAKETVFPVRVELRDGASSIVLDGRARIDAPGFNGTVKIDGLDLPRLAAASGRPDPGPLALLRSATLRSDLTLQAGLGSEGASANDDLRVSGDLTLSSVELGDGTKDVLGIRFEELAVDAAQALVPGVLARGGPRPTSEPIRVSMAGLRLLKPEIDAVRKADGIALPKALADASAAEQGEGGATRAGTSEDDATGVPPAPPPQIEIARLHVERGRLTLDDRSVTPFFKNGLSNLRIDARGIAWPGRRVQKLDLAADALGGSKLKLTGTGDATGATLVFDGQKIPLAPLNPYATAAGYSIRSGEMTLVSSIWLGAIGFEAQNWVTLHGFDLAELSSDGRFQESFGISLPLGIALLKDLKDNIQLTIPVWQDAKGFGVGVGQVIRGALASALLGAVTSPLKLLGSIVRPGAKVAVGVPEPIRFVAGSDVLSGDAIERIEAVAQVLSGQPSLVLSLQPVASPADERRLRELALLAEIERGGVLGTLRSLPKRGALADVRETLKTGKSTLDDAAQALLEERIAPIVLPADRLPLLAATRLDRVLKQLRESHGIPERQLLGRDAVIAEAGSAPEVRILFGR